MVVPLYLCIPSWFRHVSYIGSIPPGIFASRRGRKFFGGGGLGFPCCDAVCYVFWFLGNKTHCVPGKVEDIWRTCNLRGHYDIETLILWRFVEAFYVIEDSSLDGGGERYQMIIQINLAVV